LIIDFDQLWWTATLPQAKKWSQAELICQWHQALARMGFTVDIVRPNEAWPSDLRVVVAPGMQMIEQAFIDQLTAYVNSGGHLVFTPRTGLQDRTGQFFEADRASSIKELIGGEVEAYDALPDATDGLIDLDGTTFKWQAWGELLFADEGTRVWAKYANMFYAGAPAITHRKHKNGSVTYCGVFGGRDLAEAVIEKLADVIGHDADPLPDRVRVTRRGAYMIALNFGDQTVATPAPKDVQFVLGSRQLAPAGVAIWKA
jgi:beta-galactosidase